MIKLLIDLFMDVFSVRLWFNAICNALAFKNRLPVKTKAKKAEFNISFIAQSDIIDVWALISNRAPIDPQFGR